MSTNNSILKQWWWKIDNIMLVLILSIISVGCILITTASPAVAERIGLPAFFFVNRQIIYLLIGISIMLILSTMSPDNVKKIMTYGLIICFILLILVLILGNDAKGARRWISLAGFSLQPSELMKPCFVIVIARILQRKNTKLDFPGFFLTTILYLVLISLLLMQPDFGMTVSFTIVTAGQMFLAGLPIIIIIIMSFAGMLGVLCCYFFFPHVAARIDKFLSPDIGQNYQVEKSLEAYANGNFFGQGPGEGSIKLVLPDSHTDFIFAVAGEEFGAFFCTIIIALFFAVIARGVFSIRKETNLFILYTVSGLLMHFAFQAVFNIGVTLHLFPTKGMTLPFISYGGSSTIAFSIMIGIILCLTKRNDRKLRMDETLAHH